LLAVSGAEQKKFRIAICMVEDGMVDEYDLVCPHDSGSNRKEVFQIVYGNDIMDVKGKFVKYMPKE
jgi:hypothetical protein